MEEKSKKNKRMLIAAIVILALGVILLVAAKIYEANKSDDFEQNDTVNYSSVSKAEKKLKTKIPVLSSVNKKDVRIETYGPGWPWHAYVIYSKDSKLEMAKKTNDLVIPAKDTALSTKERKDVGYISVEYISENEGSPYKKATWRYNNISYAFQLSTSSELDIEECVKDIINQINPTDA